MPHSESTEKKQKRDIGKRKQTIENRNQRRENRNQKTEVIKQKSEFKKFQKKISEIRQEKKRNQKKCQKTESRYLSSTQPVLAGRRKSGRAKQSSAFIGRY